MEESGSGRLRRLVASGTVPFIYNYLEVTPNESYALKLDSHETARGTVPFTELVVRRSHFCSRFRQIILGGENIHFLER